MKTLSIIMPVYNEIKTIRKILNEVEKVKLAGYKKEIVIVDDFSSDGTREFLQKLNGYKILFHNRNMGKTAALRTGIKHVTGDYTIIQDADLEYSPSDYRKLVEKAEEKKADIVYGSRFMNKVTHKYRLLYLGNKLLSWLTSIFFGSKITDMETCYKLIKTKLLKGIEIESEGFGFEAEVTVKLLKKGHKIYEVPISYKGRPYSEGKKIGVKDGLSAAWLLLKYRLSK